MSIYNHNYTRADFFVVALMPWDTMKRSQTMSFIPQISYKRSVNELTLPTPYAVATRTEQL